jgi:hypothetical protein
MKFLEFYFNPKGRAHTQYESFCYKPGKPAEKKLGYFMVAGELANILPPNEKLLREIAETCKNAYYSSNNQTTQEAIEKALEAGNVFLDSLRKKGNVSWLGNLHLAILAISGVELFFTKTGTIKVFLARNGELLDIGKNLEASQVINPVYTFSHLVAGRLSQKDYLFCITKDIFQFFQSTGILPQLVALEQNKEEKTIKNLLKQYEKQLKDYSGLIVTVVAEKIETDSSQGRKFSPLTLLPKFPLRQREKFFPDWLKLSLLANSLTPSLRPHTVLSRISEEKQKKFFLVATLLVVLLLGFTIAQFQRKMAVNTAQEKILRIQQKIWSAENKLLTEEQKGANLLFQEALQDLESFGDAPLKEKREKLEKELRERLAQVNKKETVVAEPVFSTLGSVQNVLRLGDTFYFAKPGRGELESWNPVKNEKQLLPIAWSFDIVKEFQNFLFFYENRSNRLIVRDGEEIKLSLPYSDFSPVDAAVFQQSIYFLDAAAGKIVKYEFLTGKNELIPQIWTVAQVDFHLSNAVSLAVDGSIWVLIRDGAIHRYWGGTWQETLNIVLWPKLSNPTKIYTKNRLPYLYILDPPEKRLVILDKKGTIIKQYTSLKFDRLKDFIVSEDGKTIYLLNDKSLYQLQFEL